MSARATLNAGERALRILVVAVAVLAAVCSMIAVVSMASGARPLIFRSGSMSPAIPAGSLAFTRSVDAADLVVGDVVTVKVGSQRVTHRIVAVDHHDDVALLQLKGDGNAEADPTIYPVREADRTWFSVPHAGAVVARLGTPAGGACLAGYLLLVLLVLSRWTRKASAAAPSPAFARRTRAVAGSTAVLTFAAGAFGSWVMPTWAFWSDTANTSAATISTGTWDVAAPASAVTNVTPVANAAGWYNANITVSLTATDPAPSSGVAGIHYILNGGTEQVLPGATGNVSITTEGTNTLEYWAVDNAGFVESPHHTATYMLDKTPPPAPVFTTISSDTGVSGTDRITSTTVQTLSGTAEAGAKVTVKQGAATLGTTTADGSGNFTFGPVNLALGTNTFTATATDVADNVSPVSAGFVVTLDNVVPNSVVISPNDNLWHNSTAWSVTANDVLSGVASISWRIGAGAFTPVPTTNGTAVNLSGLAQGSNTVEAYASDVAGMSTSGAPVTAVIKVDTVKPTATLNVTPGTPGNSPWLLNGAANVTGNDATSGVASVDYQIDNGAIVNVASGTGFVIPDGVHTVTYRATDVAGNVGDWVTSASYSIDSTKPVVTNPVPANGATGTAWSSMACPALANQLCVTATDATSGVGSVSVALSATSGANAGKCWNGTSFVTPPCTAQPMTLVSAGQYRTSGLTAAVMVAGSYTTTYTAVDVAGNPATTLTTSFTINAVATVPVAPVVTSCVRSGNFITLTWSQAVDPDNFRIQYTTAAPAEPLIAGNLRTGTTSQVNLNNNNGEVWVVAINTAGTSPQSNHYVYTGNGGNATCVPKP